MSQVAVGNIAVNADVAEGSDQWSSVLSTMGGVFDAGIIHGPLLID